MKKKIAKVLLKILDDWIPKVVGGLFVATFYAFVGTCIGMTIDGLKDFTWSIGKCVIVGNIILSLVVSCLFVLMKL